MLERTCINLPNETVYLGDTALVSTHHSTTQSPSWEVPIVCVCVCVCVGVSVRSEVTKCSMRSSNFLIFGGGGGREISWPKFLSPPWEVPIFKGERVLRTEYPILGFLTTFSPTRSSLASQIVFRVLHVCVPGADPGGGPRGPGPPPWP